jgi:hypothetical protein
MAPLMNTVRELCQRRTCETGHGTCALICMEQADPRNSPHGCAHALRVFERQIRPTLRRGGVMRLNAYLKAQSQ